MENNSSVLRYENTNSENEPEKSTGKPFSIISVRVISCFLIISGCLFVKVKNPKMFEKIRVWYQKNVCQEMISVDSIEEKIQNILSSINSKGLEIYNEYIKPNV